MSRASRRSHPHHYAAEPIVCVAEYPTEQQHSGVQKLTVVLMAGVLLWLAFSLS